MVTPILYDNSYSLHDSNLKYESFCTMPVTSIFTMNYNSSDYKHKDIHWFSSDCSYVTTLISCFQNICSSNAFLRCPRSRCRCTPGGLKTLSNGWAPWLLWSNHSQEQSRLFLISSCSDVIPTHYDDNDHDHQEVRSVEPSKSRTASFQLSPDQRTTAANLHSQGGLSH